MAPDKEGKEFFFQMTEEDILEAEQNPHLGPALDSPEEIGNQTTDMLREMQRDFLARRMLSEEGA